MPRRVAFAAPSTTRRVSTRDAARGWWRAPILAAVILTTAAFVASACRHRERPAAYVPPSAEGAAPCASDAECAPSERCVAFGEKVGHCEGRPGAPPMNRDGGAPRTAPTIEPSPSDIRL